MPTPEKSGNQSPHPDNNSAGKCRRSAPENTDTLSFGEHSISSDYAHHAPGVARLNHGSFGAAPKHVLDEQTRFREKWVA